MKTGENANIGNSAHHHIIVKPAKTGIRFSMQFLQERLGMTEQDHVLITFAPDNRTTMLQAFNPFKSQLPHSGESTAEDENDRKAKDGE